MADLKRTPVVVTRRADEGSTDRLLFDSDLEDHPAFCEQVSTIQRLHLERPARVDPHPKVVEPIIEKLRTSLAKIELGPVAEHFAREALAAVDTEHGTWREKAVDVCAESRRPELVGLAQRISGSAGGQGGPGGPGGSEGSGGTRRTGSQPGESHRRGRQPCP